MINKFTYQPFKTVLTICGGLLVISLLTKMYAILFIVAFLFIVSFFSKSFASLIDQLWMKLSLILSKIVPPILLTIIFYVFLTPIAILSRIFGEKNPLHLKNKDESLFITVNKSFEKSSFEKPW
jgi:hypothetical protein